MSMDPDTDTLALQPRPNWAGQKCRPRRRFGGHDYEIFVTLLFESGYRHRINCNDAVQPERHGNGGNRAFGQRHSSEHHGPGAEASYQAAKADPARGDPRHRTPHRIPCEIADHRNAIGWARVSHGKA